ncbi:TetR/AcrR family transcriptional regulator [Thermasporomyces composti]|jgi:AcrR family transcriptional regulator|uniref:TetR family transcriptional regulator n=1 Tax=Thermasporomyces composti TaxID=696763 RepID=A0A3D9VAJ5_THECX|nr:TetR/AcrR family transcriptional regulator [Thermasporomyces composti]REF36035.1 TetR family transcriptional regulator [Thermasporomyces composti]
MDSRERLVQAMSELLWERGYADTSPREVRQRSGVGQGSMYHHFPTKRDLALAALERNIADLASASAELDGPGDPLSRVEAHLMRPRDALKGCKVGRMTQDPQVREDPELLALVARAFAEAHSRWARALREAVDAGQFRDDVDPERLAYTLMAVLQGGYVLAIAQQDPGPFEEARRGALDLLRAATRPATTTTHGGRPGADSTRAGPAPTSPTRKSE